MLDFLMDLIVDWIVFPLFEMLSSKHTSGKWRLWYLFPVATALGAVLWWVGAHFTLVPVWVLGMLITVFAGIASVITFIPRQIKSWRDLRSYRERRESEFEAAEEMSEKEL